MLKMKSTDLPFAVLFAKAKAVPATDSPPGKALMAPAPAKEVRSGFVPCGEPMLNADTSIVPPPIVALIVAGVAVDAVVAGRPAKSQASSMVAQAGDDRVVQRITQRRSCFIVQLII